jgi:chemotaxis protein histidine kinase CheA
MPLPDEVDRELAELRKAYARELPEKVLRIETACESFFSQGWDVDRCTAACRSAHSLAGSSGTYGFGELGKIAKSLEVLIQSSLDRKAPLDAPQVESARKHLAALREGAVAAADQA